MFFILMKTQLHGSLTEPFVASDIACRRVLPRTQPLRLSLILLAFFSSVCFIPVPNRCSDTF